MKLKTTKKEILSFNACVFSLPYCTIDNELTFIDELIKPCAYTRGVYGWNCDIYDLGGFIITCGYRPFNNVNSTIENKFIEICKQYAHKSHIEHAQSIHKQYYENLLIEFKKDIYNLIQGDKK